MKRYPFLIIGNSAAAVGAIEGIREIDQTTPIGLISDEPHHTHSRALIPFYLMGRLTREGMNIRPGDFYRKFGVDAMLGRAVTRVDTEKRTVLLSDGETVGFGQLLLATGGKPITPPFPGNTLKGIYTFQSIGDVDAVAAALPEVQSAVVIGGGLIGMLAAEALSELGRKVTVVELLPRIMAPVFDDTASGLITELFARRGVRILTGTAVTEILPSAADPSRAGGVKLNSGEEIAADMVIMAVGVAPRADLAKAAGLAVNRGIVVDRRGATDVSGVYAAGDCAEGYDLITGQVRPMPIWPRAYSGGRIVGHNMAGRASEGKGDIAMNSSHFFGFAAMSAGIHDTKAPGIPPAAYEELISSDPAEGYYQKVVLLEDRLVGFVVTGSACDRAGIMTGIMKEGLPVTEFRDRLVSKRALNSLPEELRRRRLQGR